MTRVTVDDTLRNKLHNFTQSLEFCDDSGRVLGRFVPVIDLAEWELVTPDVSEEELDERERGTEWYSTEEVLAHLNNLEKQ